MFSEQAENFCLRPQSLPTTILIQLKTAKDSPQREPLPYICGLRARIECEQGGEHSTRRDRVTNIGMLLSFGASVS